MAVIDADGLKVRALSRATYNDKVHNKDINL